MTYQQAIDKLGARESRKIAHCTYLVRCGENFEIRYHETAVVTIRPDGTYRLDSGGWYTRTTRVRILGALPRPGFIRGPLERNGDCGGPWTINGYEFYNGMIVDDRGTDTDYQSDGAQ